MKKKTLGLLVLGAAVCGAVAVKKSRQKELERRREEAPKESKMTVIFDVKSPSGAGWKCRQQEQIFTVSSTYESNISSEQLSDSSNLVTGTEIFTLKPLQEGISEVTFCGADSAEAGVLPPSISYLLQVDADFHITLLNVVVENWVDPVPQPVIEN